MSQEFTPEEILNRIRTVKGHLGGIEKMIEQGKKCEDILMQITAVKAAIDKIAMAIIEIYAEKCITDAFREPEDVQNKIKEVIKALLRFSK